MYDPEIWKNENNGYEELIENIKKTFASKLKRQYKTPLSEQAYLTYLTHFFTIFQMLANRNIHVELVNTL